MAEILHLTYRNVRRMDRTGTIVVIRKTNENDDEYRGYAWLPSTSQYAKHESAYTKRYWFLTYRGEEKDE